MGGSRRWDGILAAADSVGSLGEEKICTCKSFGCTKVTASLEASCAPLAPVEENQYCIKTAEIKG
jgi:hypothetical protein